MKEKIFGLRRNVFFLGLSSLFNDFSSEMVYSVLPAFFISVLHTGAASLGLVDGIADASANIIKIYSGRLSDKIRKRKIFAVLGYSLSVVTRPFYLFIGTVGGVIGIRLADRVGKGLRDAPRDALISLSTPKEEMGRSFGYHRAMDTIGAILGPLTAFLILSRFPGSFNSIFIIAFFIGLIAIGSIGWVKDISENLSSVKKFESPEKFSPSFKWYIASAFLLSAGTLPVSVLLFKTQDIGIAIASIPIFYMIYNISYAVFSIPGGWLADKLGSSKIIIAGYLALIASYLVLFSSETVPVMIVAFLLGGVFSALTDGIQRAYLSELVEERYRGSGYGYLNASVGFGALLAGGVGGFVWQFFGSGPSLLIMMSVIILGLAIFAGSRLFLRAG